MCSKLLKYIVIFLFDVREVNHTPYALGCMVVFYNFYSHYDLGIHVKRCSSIGLKPHLRQPRTSGRDCTVTHFF